MDQTFYCDTINAFKIRKEKQTTLHFHLRVTISQFQNFTIKKKLKENFPKMTDKCNEIWHSKNNKKEK